jgi:hypothetical protein
VFVFVFDMRTVGERMTAANGHPQLPRTPRPGDLAGIVGRRDAR